MASGHDLPSTWDFDDWELFNDDGFVYNRKKRRTDGPSSLARPPDPEPDPEAEEKNRRERKKRALLKVKEKYEREIALWEQFSNTLTANETNAEGKQQQLLQDGETFQGPQQIRGQEQGAPSSASGVPADTEDSESLLDKLLLRVEEQEAIIQHFTKLCDAAEALCDAHEEQVKESFLHLPIWGSPCELMASLCED